MLGNFDSFILVKKVLVYRIILIFNSCVIEIFKLFIVILIIKYKNFLFKCRSIIVNCMVFIDRGFKEKGFFKDIRILFVVSWRLGI